ncbi:hypothetical protein ERO13_D13G055200v2 [Gossypium hirsutum]|uniref:Uncharacterized CRM domain-containing protein At3g25440, chloroplastic-like isoform X1 n=2 Tax=Gossypium TaxID=3633 RepID=A0A1U8KXN4_GOSHI|nr:uncharacterized CRM domain-containing protein At3g25440, chloroplastic isoform X1 [Gossypium hirsutum]XP_016705799.1 uncharacterized CRM domain-containing protein At3g25440, chloroplastic isoform X1 [Gossypium hirsutum]KAG4110541.1 hypothetical protein ERO13_D13G055200v2 [Gossypium hirsutum]KAG4110542.1 hypothetical protein ERO13_D13G055200v2 [Gossypium hirsutum]
MATFASIRQISRQFVKREPLLKFCCFVQNESFFPSPCLDCITFASQRSYSAVSPSLHALCVTSPDFSLLAKQNVLQHHNIFGKWLIARYLSNASIELKTDEDVIRFSFNKSVGRLASTNRKRKMSKKAKVNELRFYRLKAKKKMNSPNPEVRIRYKLEKAKRKEAWLIEKLRKYEVLKAPAEAYDPEILTEEEIHYLKRTGEKKKNYVQVGRRGVFGGVVLNMHLHWKKHETVKVICKPCKLGQVLEYAEELARLSKGIVIDIKPNNTIIFYRGRNYVQPNIMSPADTLSKSKALEKYKYEQSLDHTSEFIENLEKELEEYLKHKARCHKAKESEPQDFADDNGCNSTLS